MWSARQVVSAELGGHVSSSTLSAHQMARAGEPGEPADSDGSIEWVKLHVGDTDQSCYWNRRTRETTWRAPGGYRGRLGRGESRSLVSLHINTLRCLLGDGLRGGGLGIPSPLLGCHSSCYRGKSGSGEYGLLPGAVRGGRHGVVWLLLVAGWRTWCVGMPSSLWSSLLLAPLPHPRILAGRGAGHSNLKKSIKSEKSN